MGLNPGYLLKSFLLYYVLPLHLKISTVIHKVFVNSTLKSPLHTKGISLQLFSSKLIFLWFPTIIIPLTTTSKVYNSSWTSFLFVFWKKRQLEKIISNLSDLLEAKELVANFDEIMNMICTAWSSNFVITVQDMERR